MSLVVSCRKRRTTNNEQCTMRAVACVAILFYLIASWAETAFAAKEWYDYYQDGVMAMRNHRWEEAIENFENAVAGNPQPGKRVVTPGNWILKGYYPYLQLGIAYLRLGQPEAAEKHLNKALSLGIEPRVEVYKYLAEVDEIMKKRIVERRSPEFSESRYEERVARVQATPTPVPVPTSISEVIPELVQKPVPAVPPLPTPMPRSVEIAPPIPTLTPTMLAGTLYLNSIPSRGTVFLNNQRKGETPLSLEQIKEGTYDMEIVKRGYPIYRAKVAVLANQVNKYTYTLGEYDCDHDSLQDRNPLRSINLETFMRSGQAAEVDYNGGDCTDWFNLQIHRGGKWTFEIQLLDNTRANIELQIYGPNSSTKFLGSGVRDFDHPEVIRFILETPIPSGLYYIKIHAKGKGDRALYKPQYYPAEEVVAAFPPIVANITPTPPPTPTEFLSPFATKTDQEIKPTLKWRKLLVKNPYTLLAVISAAFCLAFAALLINRKSKSRHPPKPMPSLKAREDSAVGAPALPYGVPDLDSLEEDDETLFLMRLDFRGK